MAPCRQQTLVGIIVHAEDSSMKTRLCWSLPLVLSTLCCLAMERHRNHHKHHKHHHSPEQQLERIPSMLQDMDPVTPRKHSFDSKSTATKQLFKFPVKCLTLASHLGMRLRYLIIVKVRLIFLDIQKSVKN